MYKDTFRKDWSVISNCTRRIVGVVPTQLLFSGSGESPCLSAHVMSASSNHRVCLRCHGDLSRDHVMSGLESHPESRQWSRHANSAARDLTTISGQIGRQLVTVKGTSSHWLPGDSREATKIPEKWRSLSKLSPDSWFADLAPSEVVIVFGGWKRLSTPSALQERWSMPQRT